MTIRNRILLTAVALSAAIVSLPTTAKTYVDITIAPPQVEVVPAPRVGYVWAPGYCWNGHTSGQRRMGPRATRLALGARRWVQARSGWH
jgi:hypothetical protein